jgi:type III secretory pathway component EscS
MTAFETRVRESLATGVGATEPAPDLFARVRGSIEEDRRRRRVRLRVVVAVASLIGVAGSAALMIGTSEKEMHMPWWVLELVTIATLIVIALWLGPFIKRFGRAYAADVFRANPGTGKSYIVLTDIVYYLIFAAYILFLARLERPLNWDSMVSSQQGQDSVVRVGGILLIIGVLHGVNIVIMPVIGRLFSLNRRLDAQNLEDRPDG